MFGFKQNKKKDLIERDERFVYETKINRSGWTDRWKSPIDFLMGPWRISRGVDSDKKKDLQRFYRLCSNRIVSMRGSKPISLSFNAQVSTAATDGKQVLVSTRIADDNKKEFPEKCEIMLGLTTHEMAHVLYSSYNVLQTLENKGSIHKSVGNIIEDERIEHILGDQYPGYMSSIAVTKDYFFNKENIDNGDKEIMKRTEQILNDVLGIDRTAEIMKSMYSKKATRIAELMNCLLKVVRYPKTLDKDLAKKHRKELNKFRKILTPYPVTPDDMQTATFKIARIIGDEIRNLSDPPTPSAGSKVTQDNDGEDQKTSGESAKQSPTDSKSEDQKTTAQQEEDQQGDKGDSSKEEEISPLSKGEEAAIKDAIAQSIEIVHDFLKSSSLRGMNSREMCNELLDNLTIDYKEDLIEDVENDVVYHKGNPNKDRYKMLEGQVSGPAAQLAGALYVRTYSEVKPLRGMRSGSLDGNRIIEAVHGVANVYDQRIEKIGKKVNVTMLIDESGSMGGSYLGSKSTYAAQAAILVEKAFQMFPRGQLFIYGFSSSYLSDKNYCIRYKEPGLNVRYGLGDVTGRGDNRDGVFIRSVAKRVRTFTNDPMLYIIISDGQPSSHEYTGWEAVKDTRKAVEEVKKMNFFPVQIGIQVNSQIQAKMFTDYINYYDPKQMVNDIRKLILQKAFRYIGV